MPRHLRMGITAYISGLSAWLAAVTAHLVYPDLWILPPFFGWLSGIMYASGFFLISFGREVFRA
jgi:hypothetical protein